MSPAWSSSGTTPGATTVSSVATSTSLAPCAFLYQRRTVAQDTRRDYGEDRFKLTGAIDGRVYVVVYTVRESAIRIISARKASRKEVAEHGHDTHQD